MNIARCSREATALVARVEQTIQDIRDRKAGDDRNGTITGNYHSEGVGRRHLDEIRDIQFVYRYRPGSREPLALDYTRSSLATYEHSTHQSFESRPDGCRVYSERKRNDGTGLVHDTLEEVHLSPRGDVTYSATDLSPRLTNWFRQNRALELLSGMAVGAGILGALGYLVGGAGVACVGAAVGAATVGWHIRENQDMHPDAPHSRIDEALLRPAHLIYHAANGAGVLGSLFLLGAAVA
ncbi:hypothetical protein DYH09_10325 [bacterium CPR1]|nr:hypothetical protein [bacterium CPR1]